MDNAPYGSAAVPVAWPVAPIDTGLNALCLIAGYHRIAAQPEVLAKQMALGQPAVVNDILRAARLLGMKARHVTGVSASRLVRLPTPAIARLKDGGFAIFSGTNAAGQLRLVDPATMAARELEPAGLLEATDGSFILLQRKFLGAGASASGFGFRWFLPSIWRYRR